MRILHVSDLHFCDSSLRKDLEEVVSEAKRLGLRELALEVGNSSVIRGLGKLISQEDPDLLVVTGDITTFGDRESFRIAEEWIKPLLDRPNGLGRRKVVVVPGNHDVLAWQLAALETQLSARRLAERLVLGWKTRGIRRCLRRVRRSRGQHADSSTGSMYDQFNAFASAVSADRGANVEFRLGNGSNLYLSCFNTVSEDIPWLNVGEVKEEEVRAVNQSAMAPKVGDDGHVRVAVLHHNPISSPFVAESKFSHAYNAMPEGSRFLRVMQEKGIDIVLHGHQHEEYLLRYDFGVEGCGHVFAVGCRASGVAKGGGASVLEITDRNSVRLKRYRYDEGHAAFRHDANGPDATVDLCLEQMPPRDLITRCARAEIKRYLVPTSEADEEEENLWQEVQRPGSELVYMAGRSLSEIAENRFQLVRGMLTGGGGSRVRILLSNPRLLRVLAARLADAEPSEVWGAGGRVPSRMPAVPVEEMLLGPHETLAKLAERAERTFDLLVRFIEGLSIDERTRLDVRVAHTLLPFSATVRDVGQPSSTMVLQLLPQGALKAFRSPVLRLVRRTDRTLFDYYVKHLRYLLGRGATVLGAWGFGTNDLRIEGLEDPND